MVKKYVILVILLSLLSLNSCARLIPDTTNPIIMTKPTTKESNTKISLKFKFANNSKGLLNKQVLGISFPKIIGSNNALFDLYNKPNIFRYSCELYYNNVLIKTNPVIYNPSSVSFETESNTAYCQIDDPYNAPLIPSSNKSVVFTVFLSQITITSLNFIRNLELLTATSAGIDKIIIDSYNNFGSLALYSDPIFPPALEIMTANSLVTKGPAPNKIYVLNTFDITLTIKCNSFISFRDSLFVIKFPTDSVTTPTGISTSSNDPIDVRQQALKAEKDQLSLTYLTNDSVSILGINEDLVAGRQFKLTLKNFTAISAKASNKNIELIIYYLNSYSQLSYSANDCFTISLIELENLSIAHPDLDKIFSGHAYPIDFTFSVNTEINMHTLVSFQHSKALDSASGYGGAKLNFIASTCDFTMNGSFNTYFGQRPKCYPMLLDFNYPGLSSNSEYLGSGIVFKANSLTGKLLYKVRVWIVFDDCGSTNNPLLLESTDNKLNPFVEFKFNIRINQYNKSNKTKLNYDTGISYVETLDIVTKTPCWQSSKKERYTTEDKSALATAGDWLSSEITDTSNNGILLVKEINNFNLMETWTDADQYNAPDSETIKSIYLNNPSQDFSTRPNYLFLKSDFKMVKDESIYKFFPLNLSYVLNTKSFSALKGTLEFRFSRNWLKTGNYEPNQKACWVSWGFKGAGNPLKNTKIYSNPDDNTTLISKKNLIYIAKEPSAVSSVNLTSLILPNSSGSDMVRIASKFQENTNNFDFTTNFNYKTTENNETNSFLLYTNCLAINEKPPQIKSIYSYFEGYINWIYSKTDLEKKYTLRVIRYLKLFPSLGFFNDLSADNRISLGSNSIDNLFKFHYVNTKNQDVNSICILEVSAETLKKFQDKIDAKTQNSFIFQINTYNLSLLETDYENIALNYPMMQSFKDESDSTFTEISSDYNQSAITLNSTNKSYSTTLNIDSNLHFNSDDNSKLITYAYMSANVRILNLKKIANTYSASNTNNDILIPTSCPFRKLTETDNYKIFALPVITTFLYSYDVFENLNKNFIYATLNSSSDSSPNIFLTPENNKKYKSHSIQYSTLRFTQYSITDTVNLNILFGTNFSKSEYEAGKGIVNCSAMSLLLNSDIEIDKENIEFNIKSNKFANSKVFYSLNKDYLNSNYFYLNKIGFNKLLIGISGTSIQVADQNNNKASDFPASPQYIIKGIKRPTIDSFILNVSNQIYFNYADKIGFVCIGYTETDYYATNFVVYKDQNNNVANFILDINIDNSKDWAYTFKSITKNSLVSLDDNNSILYLNEFSGNFKLNIYLPLAAPNGSILELDSTNNFNKNTICGIINTLKNNLVHDCYTLDNLSTEIYCPIYSKTRTDIPASINDNNIDPNIYLSVCCYNVSIKDKISFSSLYVNLNLSSSVKGLSDFLSSSFIKDNSSVKDIQINTHNLRELSKLDPVSIKSISYLYSNHEGAIAKLKMQINFPREIIRNSKMIISTSAFSKMLIPNAIQECFVFSDNEESSKIDPFIKSCALNLQVSLRTIVIEFKKQIYSCGIKLPNTLNILITPVKIINFIDFTYKINWFLNDTGDNITNFDAIQTFPVANLDAKVLKKTPYLGDCWANLCNIIKIFPRLISVYAYYDFEINTFLLNSSPDNFNLNEFSVFFPSNFYDDENLSNVFCEVINFPKILCKCQLEEKGILTVKFNQSIYNNIENPRVRIIGLQNPGIESDYLAFPCTINYISSNKSDQFFNSRYNVITGSGILKGGLNNDLSRIGNIRIFNSKNFVSDLNPRSRGTYLFKFSFDFSSGITLPLMLTNNPVLIVNFPEQYALFKYAFSTSSFSVSINAFIEEVIQGENNSVTSNGFVPVSKIDVINNSLFLYLSDSTRTIPQNLRFWRITLNYIPAPSETVLTGTYGLVLTNTPNTIYIENFTNADTLFTEVDKSSSDPFLPYLRGINFYYDNLKIILDVFDKTASSSDPNFNSNNNSVLYNYVILKPGFFKDIQIQARSTSKSLQSSITEITLEDRVFKTNESSYKFSTSNPIINLRLGAPCNTLKGTYFINFKVSNSQNFLEMSPVTVIVGDVEPSSIGLETITSIPLGSSQIITYSLEEKNVDALDIRWDSDPKNDSSALIESISILSGREKTDVFFSITNANNNSTQVFTSKDPNACFKLLSKNLSFKFDSTYADLSPFIDDYEKFKKQFFIFNYDTLGSMQANSIKIIYTPVVYPIYLFCAIVCYDSDFPADEDILGVADKNWFFQKYINSQKKMEFEFTNLMKNSQYKLKCIAQTTQANIRLRSQVSVEILQLNQREESGFINAINITTGEMPRSRCLRFKFQRKIVNIVKDALINFCQDFYKTYNGCVVCLDNTKRNSLGIDPRTFYGCNLNEGMKNVQIINEKIIIDGPLLIKSDNEMEYTVFTLCPVQDLFCPSTLSAKDFEKSVYGLLSNLSSDTLISINVRLPFLRLSEVKAISDSIQPDINSFSFTIVSTEEKGFYSFLVSNPQAVNCYYSILLSNILYSPKISDVLNCKDYARCGIAKVNAEKSVIFSTKDNMRIFSNGNYSVWFVCYNDLPNPVTKSVSKKFGEFNINAYKKPINTTYVKLYEFNYGILFIFLLNILL
jgi:hypothetical protein